MKGIFENISFRATRGGFVLNRFALNRFALDRIVLSRVVLSRFALSRRWAFLALLMIVPVVHAQLISVRGVLDADSIMIGDQVEFSLRVEADPGLEFRMPELEGALGQGLEILSRLDSDSAMEEGRLVVAHRYLLTGFEGGAQMIPAQDVLYRLDEMEDTARSMPLFIRVYEPEMDTTGQIRAIKDPINTPLSAREVLPWVGISLGGVLLVFLVWFLIKYFLRRRKDPEAFAMKKQEPAHVVAFRELDQLKESKLWESGQVKSFYTRLTEISRRYIENQYGIPAMESTTSEILRDFRRVNMDDDLLDEMLQELLELADLVKFAKEAPLPMENQTHLNNAYIFVQKTYPMFYQENAQVKDE